MYTTIARNRTGFHKQHSDFGSDQARSPVPCAMQETRDHSDFRTSRTAPQRQFSVALSVQIPHASTADRRRDREVSAAYRYLESLYGYSGCPSTTAVVCSRGNQCLLMRPLSGVYCTVQTKAADDNEVTGCLSGGCETNRGACLWYRQTIFDVRLIRLATWFPAKQRMHFTLSRIRCQWHENFFIVTTRKRSRLRS